MHYDLRLEAAGVLLSWAVPKGPTLDPDKKRLAVRVDDHSLDYFDYEGMIPHNATIRNNEHGGSDVIVWDWGTWQLGNGTDALAALEAGNLHFDLFGQKLGGRFVLVRRGRSGSRDQWFLMHKRDEAAVVGWDPEDYPRSVKTSRTNDEVRDALS